MKKILTAVCFLLLNLMGLTSQAAGLGASMSFVSAPPSQMLPNQAATITVRAYNSGSETWTTDFAVTVSGANWGVSSVAIPNNVTTGNYVDIAIPIVAPSTTGAMTFAVSMGFGSGASTTITVVAQQHTLSLVSNSPVEVGKQYTISWNAGGGATSVTSNCPGISSTTGLPLSGQFTGTALSSWIASPAQCTLYTVGAGITTNATTEVRATAPPPAPVPSISSSPSNFKAGSPWSISWSAQYASTATLSCTGGGYTYNGAVSLPGSVGGSSAPAGWANTSTSCTLTATSASGVSRDASIAFSTAPADPPPSPAPTFSSVTKTNPLYVNEAYSLAWTTANATSVGVTCTNGMAVRSGLLVNDALTGTVPTSWQSTPPVCTLTAYGNGTAVQQVTMQASSRSFLAQMTKPTQLTYTAQRTTGKATVPVAATATTVYPRAVAGIELLDSGISIGSYTPSGALTQTFGFDTTIELSPGVHRLKVLATNDYGAVSNPSTEIVVTVDPPSYNDAAFQSQDTFTAIGLGATRTINIQMKNTGTISWAASGANPYRLGSINPTDNLTWGIKRVDVVGTVAKDGTATFAVPVTAPLTAGYYNFQWMMVSENAEWFGAPTGNQLVKVGNPLPAVYTLAPVSLEVQVGDTYRMDWAVSNATSVVYACTYTYAGMTPGVNVGSTGRIEGTAVQSSVGSPNTCTFTATGQDGTTTVVNATITTRARLANPNPQVSLTSSAASMQIASQSTGKANVDVVATAYPTTGRTITQLTLTDTFTPPGGSTVVNVDEAFPISNLPVTLQLATGTHVLVLTAYDSKGGSAASIALNFTVTSGQANLAQMVEQFVPSVMYSGEIYPITVRMKNVGTATWTPTGASAYQLGSQSEQDNVRWGPNRIALGASTASQGEAIFTFNVTGPAVETTTSFPFQWKMLTGASGWFDAATTAATVEVRKGTNGASAQSVTINPDRVLKPGENFTATVVMTNNGTKSWTAADYVLALPNPNANPAVMWTATNRIAVPGPIKPTETATFTFTGTAPQANGDHHFQWQMAQGAVSFGALTADKIIKVDSATGGASGSLGATLSGSPNNVRVAPGAKASISFKASATATTGQNLKLELFSWNATTNATVGLPLASLNSVATAAPLVWQPAVQMGKGEYRLVLKVSVVGGTDVKYSAPIIIVVSDSTILGLVSGVRTGDDKIPRLAGWACTSGSVQPLTYKVYRDAPATLGGVEIASGTADLATKEAKSIDGFCTTTLGAHEFSVDLLAASAAVPGGIPAGTPLYVTVTETPGITEPPIEISTGTDAAPAAANSADLDATPAPAGSPELGATPATIYIDPNELKSTILPCEDNNCVMPGALRIGLSTPLDNDQYIGTSTVFMRAVISDGVASCSKVEFNFDGQWIQGTKDNAPGTCYAKKDGVLARALPYLVQARLKQDQFNLLTDVKNITVRPLGSMRMTLTAPVNGGSAAMNLAIPLTATITGNPPAAKSVKFYASGKLIGTAVLASNIWTASWLESFPGPYIVQAKAFDINNVILAQSTVANFTIIAGPSSDVPLPINVSVPQLLNAETGSLPGSISVSGGAANYSIPINLPPGTAGMVPSLSLGYRSDNTTGSAGLGWSLDGLSNIDRCGRTVATDGISDAVRFEPDTVTAATLSLTEPGDRLCLDGQRLILVSGAPADRSKNSAYWASDAEYRTEIETFARIRTYIGTGGKRYFKVETKDGQILTYGDTADSYVDAKGRGGSLAHRWRVSRREDRSQNYISYSYLNDDNDNDASTIETGENKPLSIKWGGNLAVGTPHYASVDFAYEARPDLRRSYISGVRVDENRRLKKITTSASGAVALIYDLLYEAGNSPTSGRSLLASIVAHGENGVDTLPATTFTYGKPDPSAVKGFVPLGGERTGPNLEALAGAAYTSPGSGATYATTPMSTITSGDFNGDGKTDILERFRGTPNAQQTLYESSANGETWITSKPFSNIGGNLVVVETGDFDGDGRLDVLVADQVMGQAARSNWRICLGKDRSAGQFTCNVNPNFPANAFVVARPDLLKVKDFNADGRDDIYINGGTQANGQMGIPEGTEKFLCLAQANGAFSCTSVAGTIYASGAKDSGGTLASSSIADLDGDGRVDEIGLGRCVLRPNPTGGQPSYIWYCGAFGTGGIGGVTINSATEPGATRLFGTMFPFTNRTNIFAPMGTGTLNADLNADGYSDLVFGSAQMDTQGAFTSYASNVCYSMGHGFGECIVLAPIAGGDVAGMNVMTVGDFDGDGLSDVLRPGVDIWSNDTVESYRLCHIDRGTKTQRCDAWSGPKFFGLSGISTTEGASVSDGKWANASLFYGDFNGDGKQDILTYLGAGKWTVSGAANQAKPDEALDKLVVVKNGIGREERVLYGLTNDPAFYQSEARFPENGIATAGKLANPPRYLVRAVKRDIGAPFAPITGSSKAETRYTYAGYAVDGSGRGSLGFAQITSKDMLSGIAETSWRSQVYPNIGAVTRSRSVADNNTVLLDTVSTYNVSGKKFTQANGAETVMPYLEKAVATRLDLNGVAFGISEIINSVPDGWGNVLETVSNARKQLADTPLSVRRTSVMYPADTSKWRVADLKNTTETRIAGASELSRTLEYTYETVSGLVKTEVRQSGDSALATTMTFGRNAFGLVETSTLLSAAGTRVNSVTYESNGRFPVTRTNALGMKETLTFDARSGAATSVTDPNGLISTQTSTLFGRVKTSLNSEGTETRSYLLACTSACPPGAAGVAVTEIYRGTVRVAAPTIVFSDHAGKVLRKLSWGTRQEQATSTDSSLVAVDYVYDARGRLQDTYQPRFVSQSESVDEIGGGTNVLERHDAYDDLGRVTSSYSYDETGSKLNSSNVFNGFTVTSTNPKSHSKSDLRNAWNLVAEATDAAGKKTAYVYDAFNNLTQVTDPMGNVVSIEYDALGRRKKLIDPDLGTVNYIVDGFGQVVEHISPNDALLSRSTKMGYDKLGRMVTRKSVDMDAGWVYDAPGVPDLDKTTACKVTKSCGKLIEANTKAGANGDYKRTHSYDSVGRPSSTTTQLDTSYTTTVEYDLYGRKIRELNSRGVPGIAKAIDWRYNNVGALVRIERGPVVLWRALMADASSRITAASLGNGLLVTREYDRYTGRLTSGEVADGLGMEVLGEGYTYDSLGNVATRTQMWEAGEHFDEMFRYDPMNRLEKSIIGGVEQTFTFDDIGNITSKTGLGAYSYSPLAGQRKIPHAVKSIPGLGTTNSSFNYDDNGNLTSGAGRTASWTSWDMPLEISKSVNERSAFVYGPEHQRTKQTRVHGSTTTFIHYAGSMEVEVTGADTVVKMYWPMGLGVEIEKNGVQPDLRWTHLDRIGSPVAISNALGVVTERMAYDSWGKRRELKVNSTPDSTDGVTDNKGFTGHEMLDQLDLVHMNGRVYDPLVARFMSADPIVQDPMHSQSYNRYTYVWNNPTNLTDPTGFAMEGPRPDNSVIPCNQDTRCTLPPPPQTQDQESGESSPADGTKESGLIQVKSAGPAQSGCSGDMQCVTITAKSPNPRVSMGSYNNFSSYLDDVILQDARSTPLESFQRHYIPIYHAWMKEPLPSGAIDSLVPDIMLMVLSGGVGSGTEVTLYSTMRVSGGIGRVGTTYEVGAYAEIAGTLAGHHAHHVGQKAVMKKLVLGYDEARAPAILVPVVGHVRRGPFGIVSRNTKDITSVQQLVARDILELRRVYPGIPNSQLQLLIHLNKQMYPTSFIK